MRTTNLCTLLALLAASCSQLPGSERAASVGDPASPGVARELDEEEIALEDVPARVLAAAAEAVPGMVVSRAERELENSLLVYSLEGTVGGEPVEVEVAADGGLIEIEYGDEDDTDDEREGDD